MGDQMFVKIGVGFNLSNSHPTECLNKILNEHNLPEWKREKFIAKFMNQFEDCFMKINKTNNLNEFINDFQKYWLHSNQLVSVESLTNEDKTCQIVGINEYGYLRVKTIKDNSEHILQPDGNRFDYMNNLIILRDS